MCIILFKKLANLSPFYDRQFWDPILGPKHIYKNWVFFHCLIFYNIVIISKFRPMTKFRRISENN